MQIAYDPDAPPEFQYTVSPHSLPRKAAVDAMRNWCAPEELSAFAVARHGFMNSDSFFGITYPTDLDEWDRASGESISDGYVEALAGYGDPHSDGLLILEAEYLELLRQFLLLVRLPTHAQELATVIEKGG